MDDSLMKLPDEVLEQIVSYLSYSDKIQCRIVCSRLKNIVDYSSESGLHCIIDESSNQSLTLAKNARVRVAKFQSFCSTDVQKEDYERPFLAFPHSLIMIKIIGPIDYFWLRVKFLTHVQNSLRKVLFQGRFLAEKYLQAEGERVEVAYLPNVRVLEIICIEVSTTNSITEIDLAILGRNLNLILSTVRSNNLELLYIYDLDLRHLETEYYNFSLLWRDITLRKFLNYHKETLQAVCLPTYIGNLEECKDSMVRELSFPEKLYEYEILLTRRGFWFGSTPFSLSSIRKMEMLEYLRLTLVRFPTSISSTAMMNLPNTLRKLEVYIQCKFGFEIENLFIDGSIFSNFSNLTHFAITNWGTKWGWDEDENGFENDYVRITNLTALPENLEILYLRKVSVAAFPAISLKPFKKLQHVAIGPIMQLQMGDDDLNSYRILQHFLKQRNLQSLVIFFCSLKPSCKQIFKELLRTETTTQLNLQNPNTSIFEQCSSILCSTKVRERKLYRLWDTIGIGLQNFYPKQANNISLALGIQIDLSDESTQNLPFKPTRLRDQLSYKFDLKGLQMSFGNYDASQFKISEVIPNLVIRLDKDYTIEQSDNHWTFWQW